MALSRNYYFVYTKSDWDGNPGAWTLRPDLEPVHAVCTLGSAASTATVRRRYGYGCEPSLAALTDGGLTASLAGQFVRITRADDADKTAEQMLFCGLFPAEQYNVLGRSAAGVKTVDQTAQAVGLDWMLGSPVDCAWVLEGGQVVRIGWAPAFNARTRTGGLAGNKSGIPYLYDGLTTYVLERSDWSGTDWAQWTAYDVIDYLRRFFPPQMNVTLSIPAGETVALQAIRNVWDFEGADVRAALDDLISSAMGFGRALIVGLDDTVTLKIFSMLDTDLTVGSVTLPVHAVDDTEWLDVWTNPTHTRVEITADKSAMPDAITVRGAAIKVCGTFSVADGTLEAGWNGDAEDLYKSGVSGTAADYEEMDAVEQAAANDRYRNSDRMALTFCALRVPATWDWTVKNIGLSEWLPINPAWDPATGLLKDPTQQAPFWNGVKRFLPYLPFLEGVDYSGLSPVRVSSSVDPDLRKVAAFIQRGETWEYVDRLRPYSGTVQAMADQPGVTLRFNPQHVLALNHWTGAEPSAYEPDEETAADWQTVAVTAMLETDQMFERTESTGLTGGRRKIILAPQAELWLVAPGTVVDIGPAAESEEGPTLDARPIRYGGASPIVRNDVAVLDALMAAALAWYGRRRYRVVIRREKVEPIVELGTLLKGLDIDQTGTAGACVSGITYDFDRNTTVVSTHLAELDLPSVLAGGRSGPRTHGRGGLEKTQRRQQMTLDSIQRELAAPRRIGQSAAAGTPIRNAFCKVAAGTGATIACYLDVDDPASEEVTVTCTLIGTTNLNECFPTLSDGTMMPIRYDAAAELWRSLWWFQKKEACPA